MLYWLLHACASTHDLKAKENGISLHHILLAKPNVLTMEDTFSLKGQLWTYVHIRNAEWTQHVTYIHMCMCNNNNLEKIKNFEERGGDTGGVEGRGWGKSDIDSMCA